MGPGHVCDAEGHIGREDGVLVVQHSVVLERLLIAAVFVVNVVVACCGSCICLFLYLLLFVVFTIVFCILMFVVVFTIIFVVVFGVICCSCS